MRDSVEFVVRKMTVKCEDFASKSVLQNKRLRKGQRSQHTETYSLLLHGELRQHLGSLVGKKG